jgi:hypothetical protein
MVKNVYRCKNGWRPEFQFSGKRVVGNIYSSQQEAVFWAGKMREALQKYSDDDDLRADPGKFVRIKLGLGGNSSENPDSSRHPKGTGSAWEFCGDPRISSIFAHGSAKFDSQNGSQVIIGETVNVGSPGKSERVNTFSQSSNHAESRLTPGCVRSSDAENLLVFRRETQQRLLKILNEIEVPHAKESLHVWAWLIETIPVFSSEELEKCNVALDVSIPNLHLSEKLIGTLLQERNSSGHKGVCVQKACTNGG